jgi:hypothetical protein
VKETVGLNVVGPSMVTPTLRSAVGEPLHVPLTLTVPSTVTSRGLGMIGEISLALTAGASASIDTVQAVPTTPNRTLFELIGRKSLVISSSG